MLASWANFYVVVGSAAAALTGLMFVVITLVAQRRTGNTGDGTSIFSSPTVVHFTVALITSATMLVPWPETTLPAVALGLLGLYGLGYGAYVGSRMRRTSAYRPAFDDWLRYVIVPGTAYAAVTAGAWRLGLRAADAPFVVAAAVVLLVVNGIHNAWDVVTYVATADDPGVLEERS